MDIEETAPIAVLNNCGDGPLHVPGFDNIPISYQLAQDERFAHGVADWQQSPAVTARELAMVAVMERLTDRPNWHVDVFDRDVLAFWKKELVPSAGFFGYSDFSLNAAHLISEKAWDWIVQELRDKALSFIEQGHVRILDVGTCVCKVESTALQSLADELRRYGKSIPFKAQVSTSQTAFGISFAADPQMYPLVYGRSRVLEKGRVDLDNVFGAYDTATLAVPQVDKRELKEQFQDVIDRTENPSLVSPELEMWITSSFLWSCTYQSLPCEVAFENHAVNGRKGTDVRIASYINNLHPEHHRNLYRTIEQVLSLAIQPWNDCLVQSNRAKYGNLDQTQRGPVPLRILTYGVQWAHELPSWALAFNVRSESALKKYHSDVRHMKSLRKGSQRRRKIEDDLFERHYGLLAELNCKEKGKRRQQRKQTKERKETMARKKPPPDSVLWERAKDFLNLPENGDPSCISTSVSRTENDTPITAPDDWDTYRDSREACETWKLLKRKVARRLRFWHPEPGTAFSYQEWKAGRHKDRAIIDLGQGFRQPYKPRLAIALQDTFRDQGMQVFVEMASVELTPDRPVYRPEVEAVQSQNFAAFTKADAAPDEDGPIQRETRSISRESFVPDNEDWERPMHLNHHVVGVAVFVYDADNITEPRMAFRQYTALRGDFYRYHRRGGHVQLPSSDTVRQSIAIGCAESLLDLEDAITLDEAGKGENDKEYRALANILGFPWRTGPRDNWDMLSYQRTGSVSLQTGKLVTFPDALEHRLEPFRLVDPRLPGHLRWLKLYLVDPHYRVCSTRNVPPQQYDWVTGKGGVIFEARRILLTRGLPPEIVDQIVSYIVDDYGGWMHDEEALMHRKNVDREQIWLEIAKRNEMLEPQFLP